MFESSAGPGRSNLANSTRAGATMGGSADGAGDQGEMPDSESMRETAVHPEAIARIIRRAAILAGLVPLADMSDDEVAWVFNKLVGD